jgi:hypothetical protein
MSPTQMRAFGQLACRRYTPLKNEREGFERGPILAEDRLCGGDRAGDDVNALQFVRVPARAFLTWEGSDIPN